MTTTYVSSASHSPQKTNKKENRRLKLWMVLRRYSDTLTLLSKARNRIRYWASRYCYDESSGKMVFLMLVRRLDKTTDVWLPRPPQQSSTRRIPQLNVVLPHNCVPRLSEEEIVLPIGWKIPQRPLALLDALQHVHFACCRTCTQNRSFEYCCDTVCTRLIPMGLWYLLLCTDLYKFQSGNCMTRDLRNHLTATS